MNYNLKGGIKKMDIKNEYKKLCKEIKWRFKESNYKEDDKAQVVIHETIDKEVTYLSVADIEKLCNELGIIKILEIEKEYIDEFCEFPKEKTGIDKLRLLLYWYFERRVYEDDKMRTELKL